MYSYNWMVVTEPLLLLRKGVHFQWLSTCYTCRGYEISMEVLLLHTALRVNANQKTNT